jgi:hypothetical protein
VEGAANALRVVRPSAGRHAPLSALPSLPHPCRAGKRAILADRSGGAARAWARWLPICYALFAGLVGTQSVLFGKTISMLLRTSFTGDSQLVGGPPRMVLHRAALCAAGGGGCHRRPAALALSWGPPHRPPSALACSPQGSWYTWVSLVLFVLFAGFWMRWAGLGRPAHVCPPSLPVVGAGCWAAAHAPPSSAGPCLSFNRMRAPPPPGSAVATLRP